MATCTGHKGGAACRRPILKCANCGREGCANNGCSNCNFPGGKCANCGKGIPFSFFGLFGRRARKGL